MILVIVVAVVAAWSLVARSPRSTFKGGYKIYSQGLRCKSGYSVTLSMMRRGKCPRPYVYTGKYYGWPCAKCTKAGKSIAVTGELDPVRPDRAVSVNLLPL